MRPFTYIARNKRRFGFSIETDNARRLDLGSGGSELGDACWYMDVGRWRKEAWASFFIWTSLKLTTSFPKAGIQSNKISCSKDKHSENFDGTIAIPLGYQRTTAKWLVMAWHLKGILNKPLISPHGNDDYWIPIWDRF
jgi:hypothetical protein